MGKRFISYYFEGFSTKSLVNKAKLTAFTLAETLIVMGIIGVVAALTIPNLNSSTNNKEKVTKVKKIFAQLTEAHERATVIYGPVENWFVENGSILNDRNAEKRYFDRITEFMKLQKTCRDAKNNCTADSKVLTLASDESDSRNANQYVPQAVLADGTAIIEIQIPYKRCTEPAYYYDTSKLACGGITVDIDGPNKGKNTYGIDLFHFLIIRDGIVPSYSGMYLEANGINACAYMGQCAGWVLEKGNLDYLLVNHDNSGTYTCSNTNQTLTWEKGSCR